MKMTKKQLEELVDKKGALIGSKSISPKYGANLIGAYGTTDDTVEKTTQDRSYETPYRRYFGEDDLSNHPLFDVSQKAKSYTQFIEMAKKYKPKMDDDKIKDAAGLFGFRKEKKRIVKEKEISESILRFNDGININTSGKLRSLELYDGWYVVGEGKLIPVKNEEEAKTLIKKMKGNDINESTYNLLEKIVKIKTKEDIIPKMVKSNNHIDKAILHLKGSMTEIEKYKTNPKVSGVYSSLEKTIKSLESIVDKIEDKTELMDSINESNMKDKLSPDAREKYNNLFGSKDANPEFLKGYEKGYTDGYLDGKTNQTFNEKYSWNKYSSEKKSMSEGTLPFDEEIKNYLKKLYSGTTYDKTGKIDDRIEQLFDIHKNWLDIAKRTYSSEEIANKLFKYEKNLKESTLSYYNEISEKFFKGN